MSNCLLQTPLAFEKTDLSAAAADLFFRRKYGHLDQFYYSASIHPDDPVCGARLWARMLQHNKNYKIPVNEKDLIQKLIPFLKGISNSFEEFIDFGPGSVEAFNAKTRPLLNQLNVRRYRPIELCHDFLSEISDVMAHLDPQMTIQAEEKDFLADQLKPATNRSCLFWGGSGFENIPTLDTAGLPIDGIKARLLRVRNILTAGGLFILTLDTTRNYEELMLAYGHPLNGALTLNLLHQIKRDCPEIDLDPDAWIYQPIWRPERYLLEHHIVSTRQQTVRISGYPIAIKAGESFVTEHSFKMPISIISQIAESVGWRQTTTLGDDGQVQLLILST